MGKGKAYELSQKNIIMETTDEHVVAVRPDFSGNSKYSVADLMVFWPTHDGVTGAFIEMKKRSGDEGKRKVVMAGSSEGQNGVEELEELVEHTPPWAHPYIVVKFDHRESIVIHAERLLSHLHNEEESYIPVEYEAEQNVHGSRLTPSGNISMIKPTLDEWQSSVSGDADHIKLLEQIGVPYEHWTVTKGNGSEAVA